MVAALQAEAARLRGRRVVQAALAVHAALIVVRAVLGVVHGPGGILDPRPGQLLFFLSMAAITMAPKQEGNWTKLRSRSRAGESGVSQAPKSTARWVALATPWSELAAS